MLHQPTGRKGRSPQRHKYPQECHRIVPSSSQPSRQSGVTNVGPTTAIATHTQPRRTIVPKTVATSLTPAMHQDPTSRRCGHARRRSTPTPRAMHKQHTEPGPSGCVHFGDPHVHNVTPSYNTRQECSHSSANTMGTSPPYGEDTPDRRPVQRKEKGGGTSAKSSVLILTCVPLPHLVLPLSGCACSGTPTKATRGEARGHP